METETRLNISGKVLRYFMEDVDGLTIVTQDFSFIQIMDLLKVLQKEGDRLELDE